MIQASEGLGPLNFLGRGWRTTELTFWITTATLYARPICSVPTSKKHRDVLSS